MKTNYTRRDFIKTTGAVALTAAALPAWAQDTKKMTIAFVGVAHIHTPSYVNIVKKRSDVTVKYVWDHDANRAAQRAKDLDSQTVADVQTIWADPEVTAVVILSETDRHHDLILAAAKAGKNMFAEKPLSGSGKEALEIAAAIEKAGVLFTTGYFNRTDPKKMFLKAEIAAGNFGTVTRIRGSNCHNGSLGGWFDTDWRWMADPKIAGVGAFGDLGTHLLDIMMWLNGDIDSVTADIQPVTHRYGDCDETGEALIHFKNGVIGTLAAGWVDVANPVEMIVSGTQGHAAIINGQLYYQSEKREGSDSRKAWKDLPTAPEAPLNQFLNALAGSKDEPLVTPAEAAARVVVMEAMYKGAKKREWVNVA